MSQNTSSDIESKPVATGGGTYKSFCCTRCDTRFPSNDKLQRHIEGVHEKKASYVCQVCNKGYNTKDSLRIHMKVHQEDRPYKCDKCDAAFKSNCKLTRHKFGHEPKEDDGTRPFICKYCNKGLKTRKYLLQHEQAIHINPKPIQCDECELRFTDNTHLNIHKQTHIPRDQRIKAFKCDQCTSAFYTESGLKSHIGYVHTNREPIYHCMQCTASFTNEKYLTNHVSRVHDHVEMVECENCKGLYKGKSNLRNHQLDCYGNHKYKCSECPKTFAIASGQKRHLEKCHDVGTHVCDFCIGNRFSSIKYKDAQGEHSICRECYNTATGKNSREETKVSKYLDSLPFLKPYLLGSDTSLQSMGGCGRYRPDKFYTDIDICLQVEVDEYQHDLRSDSYTCEEQRISKIHESCGGKKLIVIRWNPHKYQPPEGTTRHPMKQRLKVLSDLIEEVLIADHTDTPHIMIHYLYYDEDNPKITQNLPYLLH